jgi:hypothetical protein
MFGGGLRLHADLVMEHVALRHQLMVLRRSGTRRPRLTGWDRLLWIFLSRSWPRWRAALRIVQPETVLRWCRCRIGLIRDRCSDDRWRGGRPRIDAEIRELTAIMAQENGLWGAPRVHGELLKLGFKVSQATVSRYLRRCPRPRSQAWRTFLRSHFVRTAPRAASEGTVDHRSSPVAHGPATLSLPPSSCAAAPGPPKALRSLRDSARPTVGGLPASQRVRPGTPPRPDPKTASGHTIGYRVSPRAARQCRVSHSWAAHVRTCPAAHIRAAMSIPRWIPTVWPALRTGALTCRNAGGSGFEKGQGHLTQNTRIPPRRIYPASRRCSPIRTS